VSSLIKEANAQIKLSTVLKGHSINIQRNGAEWGINIICPFPAHKDSNASFGYNFSTDSFHCFGCKKSGRAVEFLANKHDVALEVAANRILETYGAKKEVTTEYDNNTNEITEKLIEYGNFFNELVQKHKNNPRILSMIDKLFWVLDIYLLASSKISTKALEYRFNKIKSIFNELFSS
jgi:DNA primase